MTTDSDTQLTFWDHLDSLRAVLLRVGAVWLVVTVVAFCMRQTLFDLLLAPSTPDFVTRRWLAVLSRLFGGEPLPPASLTLINTGLGGQLMIHIRMAVCLGIVGALPYALFDVWRFVAPGLYDKERRYGRLMVVGAYVMFMLGVAVSYWMVFPLTVQFLADYQVSGEVSNLITLDSYVSSLLMISLGLGVAFELPVVVGVLAAMGLLSAATMSRRRREVIVAILIAAAVITPTTDAITLLVVSAPLWALYEASILLARRINPSKNPSPTQV